MSETSTTYTNASEAIAAFENDQFTLAAGGFTLSITVREIERTWDALSHFPDRRARIELRDLAARINDVAAFIDKTAEQGGSIDAPAEIEAFARRHIERTRRMWAVESRCMSWFIVGPANFPTARNQKRQASRDKAAEHVAGHVPTTKHAITRRAWPHGAPGEAIRASNPDAPGLIRAEIEELQMEHALMKAVNVALRKAKSDDIEAIAQDVVDATGCSHATAQRMTTPDCCGHRGFSSYLLGSKLAEIKRLQGRLTTIERNRERGEQRRREETRAGAVEIIENPDAARIQLIFEGKPAEDVRAILKGAGFRWSPRHGAWQRHLNGAGRAAARCVMQKISAA